MQSMQTRKCKFKHEVEGTCLSHKKKHAIEYNGGGMSSSARANVHLNMNKYIVEHRQDGTTMEKVQS